MFQCRQQKAAQLATISPLTYCRQGTANSKQQTVTYMASPVGSAETPLPPAPPVPLQSDGK